MPEKDFGSALYSGAANLGYARAVSGLVVGILITLSLSSAGAYFGISNDPYEKETDVTVTGSIVIEKKDDRGNNYKTYDILFTYTVDGKTYSNTVNLSMDKKIGETLRIKYVPSNPSDYKMNDSLSYRSIGLILCGIAFVILIIVLLNYYLTQRFKPYAAFSGVEGVYSFIKNN